MSAAYRATIKRHRRKINELARVPQAQAEHGLRNDLLIDTVRRQAVLLFRSQGFTAIRGREWISDEQDCTEEVRLFWLGKLDQTAPQPQAARREARDRIIVQIAACVYTNAQCKTELAARSRSPWRSLYQALLKEEIARLQWEISRALRS